ncbi:MAG: hypothetical protein ABI844_15235 [Saprospiraceae bacterium]
MGNRERHGKNYSRHQLANFGSIQKNDVSYFRDILCKSKRCNSHFTGLIFFTEKPDFSPYNFEKANDQVFDPAKAMKIYGRDFD